MKPTWRRLAAGTGALFLVILAFLAGRVRGGHDPALRDAQPASAVTQQQQLQEQEQVAPSQDDTEPVDPGVEPPVTQAS